MAPTGSSRTTRPADGGHTSDASHPSPVAGGSVTATEARAALERLLASVHLRSSPRSSEFLRFVVGEVLDGRGDTLRERAIATEALGRGPDFDPRVDPAVRVQAGRVRKSLERYYASEGADDSVRITIPAGRYIPVFAHATPGAARREAATPGIVVTALADLTPGEGRSYIAPGLSEVLVATLSRFPGVRVIGPVSLAGESAAPPDPRALGDDNAARYVLLGSVRVRGEALRVSVRLADAATRETVWSRVFDGRLDDPDTFAIEDVIVTEIAAAVADYRGIVNLRAPSGGPLATDGVVHDAMLRYYGWLGDTDPAGFPQTVRALEEAARREPDNALILAMLAGMNLVDAIDGIAGLDRPLERAQQLANRAIAIDPLNPHALAALAWLALVQRRIDVCHARLDQLLQLCPHHPTFLYRTGFVYAVTGHWDRGVALVERSIRLNPNGPGYLNFFPAIDLCLRGDDEAALRRARLVDTPGGHLGPLSRAVALSRLGRGDEARAELDALRAAVPGFDTDRPAALRKMLMPEPVVAIALSALDAIDPT